MEMQCPHCGSLKGYYILCNLVNVPVYVSFTGKFIKADLKSNNIYNQRKKAYCVSCKQIISTERALQRKLRQGTKKNPIAIYRKKKGFTQAKLAEHLNCSRESVAMWESKGVLPNKRYRAQMEQLFEEDCFKKEYREFYGI